MKKPTRPSIKKAITPYIKTVNGVDVLLREDVSKLSKMIVTEYSRVYSGISNDGMGDTYFSVRSIRAVYFEILVIDSQ